MIANTGLRFPEFLVLLALFEGKEVLASSIYKLKFKRAYQSSPAKIRMAFSSLEKRGFINKYGVTRGAKLQITALGKSTLREIINKYAINF